MSEDSHHMREPMAFQQRQELECLHFKAERRIDHKKHDVGDFGQIDHGPDVGWAFDDCNPLFLCAAQGDCAVNLVDFVLHEVFHQ